MDRQGGYNWILKITSIASYYVNMPTSFQLQGQYKLINLEA